MEEFRERLEFNSSLTAVLGPYQDGAHNVHYAQGGAKVGGGGATATATATAVATTDQASTAGANVAVCKRCGESVPQDVDSVELHLDSCVMPSLAHVAVEAAAAAGVAKATVVPQAADTEPGQLGGEQVRADERGDWY
jgi:hypothetical protein